MESIIYVVQSIILFYCFSDNNLQRKDWNDSRSCTPVPSNIDPCNPYIMWLVAGDCRATGGLAPGRENPAVFPIGYGWLAFFSISFSFILQSL